MTCLFIKLEHVWRKTCAQAQASELLNPQSDRKCRYQSSHGYFILTSTCVRVMWLPLPLLLEGPIPILKIGGHNLPRAFFFFFRSIFQIIVRVETGNSKVHGAHKVIILWGCSIISIRLTADSPRSSPTFFFHIYSYGVENSRDYLWTIIRRESETVNWRAPLCTSQFRFSRLWARFSRLRARRNHGAKFGECNWDGWEWVGEEPVESQILCNFAIATVDLWDAVSSWWKVLSMCVSMGHVFLLIFQTVQ